MFWISVTYETWSVIREMDPITSLRFCVNAYNDGFVNPGQVCRAGRLQTIRVKKEKRLRETEN